MPAKPHFEFEIRAATPGDVSPCAEICYKAFHAISQAHNFPCDLPSPEVAVAIFTMMFSHPGFHCLVAEAGGRIRGSNCLDERSIIFGIGPITVDPDGQNSGIGLALMQSVLNRAREQKAVGVRLVQAAYHNRSLSLYASLGFQIREPLSCLQGRTRQRSVPGCVVRSAKPGDIESCNALSRRIHGFDRGRELADSIRHEAGLVVEREGRITGYASDLAFFGHGTAETNLDLEALIVSCETFGGPGILIPSRNSAVLEWALANGLRVMQPMTLMTSGLYNEPAGAWFPSISF